MQLPALYLISDRKTVPGGVLEDTIAAARDGGCRLVQLREKDLPAAEFFPLAERLRLLTERYHARLLINDRIDVVQACGADGVHLGGHSLPPAKARALLGPKGLIGVSTHNLQELHHAAESGADFATFGPVFATPSKLPFGDPVGLAALAEACRSVKLPVYALGGVDGGRLEGVRRSGAYGFGCIRPILTAIDPATACADLLSCWDRS